MKASNTLIEEHGRPFVAFMAAILANLALFISVYIKAAVLHRLDLPTLVVAASGVTVAAGIYAGGAAWVKGRQALADAAAAPYETEEEA